MVDPSQKSGIKKTLSSKCSTVNLQGIRQLDVKYRDMFQDLVDTTELMTELDVVNCVITYDSKNVVLITTNERLTECNIECYSLKDFEEVFCFPIKGEYIVMNEIE